MAENNNNETTENPSRRLFLNRVWAFFGLIAAAEFGWIGLSFMNSRKERNRPVKTESIITAGTVEQFTPATVTAVPLGQFYLACLADGSFLALSRTCTHLGCSVPWDEEKNQFVCPCHGSTFNLTGEVLTAPAPRPLDIYPVRIENGIVKVDTSAPQKREHFDPAQAVKL
jgi:nitrite reductase/ring-hydroxylating ferredoxin subunit